MLSLKSTTILTSNIMSKKQPMMWWMSKALRDIAISTILSPNTRGLVPRLRKLRTQVTCIRIVILPLSKQLISPKLAVLELYSILVIMAALL
jgi:hypothetical protein